MTMNKKQPSKKKPSTRNSHPRSSHPRSSHSAASKTNNYIKKLFGSSIIIIFLSLNELKLIAKNRGIRDYENKFEDDLMKILSEPKTK